MTIEIFWGSGSPFAWRALLALELKRLPYDSHLLSFSKNEHKTPAMLALNPRGKVPVLKDGGFVLAESLAILAYLERKYPEPPLFGRTAEEAGAVWKAVADCVFYFDPPVTKIAGAVFFSGDLEAVRPAVPEVRAEIKSMEQRLTAQPWLAAGAISAADIAVLPMLEILLRAAAKDAAKPLDLGVLPIETAYPAIAKWRDRIRALPAYDKTYPPHWRG
jgi:glutathione S-transferase